MIFLSSVLGRLDPLPLYGVCGNVNDLAKNIDSQQWSQAIPTIGIQRGMQDWQATQQSTLYGTNGGTANIQSLKGTLNTANESGLRVMRDDQASYEVKIPIYNQKGLQQLGENVSWLGDQMKPKGNTMVSQTPAYLRHSSHETTHEKPKVQQVDDDMPELIDETESLPQHLTHEKKEEPQTDDHFIENAEKVAAAPIPDTTISATDLRPSCYIEAENDENYESKTVSTTPQPKRSSHSLTMFADNHTTLDGSAGNKWKTFWQGVEDENKEQPTFSSQDTANLQQSNWKELVNKAANSSIVSDINIAGDWLNRSPYFRAFNELNPFVVAPVLLDQAYQSLSIGNLSDAIATTGFAVVSSIPADRLAFNMLQSSAEYLRDFSFFRDEAAASIARGAEEFTTENLGNYRVPRPLPRCPRTDLPVPDSPYPHSQIGERVSEHHTYTQAREWGYDVNGKLIHKKDIDFTDHGWPDAHPSPHQHIYVDNPTGGTMQRSKKAEPLTLDDSVIHDLIEKTNKFTKPR